MIILSDCLTEKVDEGALKVANSLSKRIKREQKDTMIVSYHRKPAVSDVHLRLNPLFLNPSLSSLIRKKKETVLYIPFASNTLGSAIRSLALSHYSRGKIKVLFALRHHMSGIARLLLSLSRAEIIVISKESYNCFSNLLKNKVTYITTGVDTKQFHPVDAETKEALRKKYGVAPGKKVALHVGHLHGGRNVDKLAFIHDEYHLFLVVSSVTHHMKDDVIRRDLLKRPNTTIIEDYVENIQELYQMADVYVFPVEKAACIDIPLSTLEAAACGLPVVCTRYGELKEFEGKPGFFFIDSVTEIEMNDAMELALREETKNISREAVLKYDWSLSIKKLTEVPAKG